MNANGHDLSLFAMTLRGFGSYFYGQRLDLQPLTIICGENGSGKSTWFKAWNLLRDSLSHPNFPFTFVSDSTSWCHGYTNAYLKRFPENRGQDSHADNTFGPYGTIGLHFKTVEDLVLQQDDRAGLKAIPESASLLSIFLRQGRCPKGTRFRIRLAHPDVDPDPDDKTLGPRDLVELQINDADTISFRKGQHDNRYSIECSATFFTGKEGDRDRIVKFAEYGVAEDTVYSLEGNIGFGQCDLLCRATVLRVRQLLEQLLHGIFCISAIRTIEHRSKTLDHSDEEKKSHAAEAIQARYVGPQGQWTWDLERTLAYNLMRQAPNKGTEPASWDFEVNQINDGYQAWSAISGKAHSAQPSPLKRIWELASEESREGVKRAAEENDAARNERLHHLDEGERWNAVLWKTSRRIAKLLRRYSTKC